MKETKTPLNAYQAKYAAVAAAALQDPALIGLLVEALAPALVTALRERTPDVLNDALAKPVLTVGPLTIDLVEHKVFVNGREVHLKAQEFALLVTLARRPEQVFSREQLLSIAWPTEAPVKANERTVDVHVRRLRMKLGDDAPPVKTIHRSGYRLSRR